MLCIIESLNLRSDRQPQYMESTKISSQPRTKVNKTRSTFSHKLLDALSEQLIRTRVSYDVIWSQISKRWNWSLPGFDIDWCTPLALITADHELGTTSYLLYHTRCVRDVCVRTMEMEKLGEHNRPWSAACQRRGEIIQKQTSMPLIVRYFSH